jgi:hypothetical protein
MCVSDIWAPAHTDVTHMTYTRAHTTCARVLAIPSQWLAMMAKLKDFDEAMHLLFPLSFIVYCAIMINSVQVPSLLTSSACGRARVRVRARGVGCLSVSACECVCVRVCLYLYVADACLPLLSC